MSNKNEQHTNKPKQKNQERLRLESIVANKYEVIWGHQNLSDIVKLYSRLAGLTAELDEKGIKYGKDLKTAVKFSPLEDPNLALPPKDFKQMIGEIGLAQLRRINEDFDITFFFVDEGHTIRNLRSFLSDYGYKLANFGKPRPKCGFDPNYATNSTTGHRSYRGSRSSSYGDES